jgi:SAM-dependent methyltransferase
MTTKQIIVENKNCPICGRPTIHAKAISETGASDDAGLFYYCSCGVIFNNDIPKSDPLDKDDFVKYDTFKEYDLVSVQAARIYAPFIEELTMGRKMLDIGFCRYNNINFLKKRGWVTFGIEKNKDIEPTDRIIVDDFETTDKLYSNTYDLVWLSHVLEKFKDPISALRKIKEILQNNGVLYIATPDIDFLYNKPSGEWTHWNKKENNIMFNSRSLTMELEKIGFYVVMCRRNYYSRFGFYNDLHLIAQKIYF